MSSPLGTKGSRFRGEVRSPPLVAGFGTVLLAFWLFTQGGQDDTYITYFAAHVLGETGRLVNFNGEWVEQSSSLGLVLVLGFLHAVTRVSVPLLGYALSLLAVFGSVLLVERLVRPMVGRGGSAPVALGVCTMPAFAYWGTSGMETPLVALTGLWLVLVLTRAVHGLRCSKAALGWAAASGFAFASIRPETPVLGLGLLVVAFIWCALGGGLGRSYRTLVAACGGVVLLVLIRRLVFGEWAPNPALVKQHGFDVVGGLGYLLEASRLSPVLVAAAVVGGLFVVGLVAARGFSLAPGGRRILGGLGRDESPSRYFESPRTTILVLAGALTFGSLGFVVLSGGDWMVGGRFLAPAMPAAGVTFVALLGRISARAGRVLGAVLLVTHLGTSLLFLHSGEPEGRPWSLAKRAIPKVKERVSAEFWGIELANKVHARDAVTATELEPLVGRAAAHLGRPVTIMSGQAGLVAYHTFKHHFGRAKFLDLWNITGRELEECLGMEPFRYSIYGTVHDLAGVLRALDERGARCGLNLPDIYFNERYRPPHQAALEPYGYVLVYHQTGTVQNERKNGWLPSHNVADGHIVMKKELAEALGLLPVRKPWKWNLDP